MLKKASHLTRPTAAVISPARPESAKTASSPMDALYPGRGPSNSLYLPLGEWPRLPSTARMGRGPTDSPTSPEGVGSLFFTARIERPPLYRGGSASKKNGLPAPSHPSKAARCASTGIVPATPSSFFQHPTRPSGPLTRFHAARYKNTDDSVRGRTKPSKRRHADERRSSRNQGGRYRTGF
jgi:hypothetical protein